MRLPSRDILPRPAVALGFAFGILLPLVLAGVLHAVMGGGLSDNPAPVEPVYRIY